jgi:hypothetical protein
VRLKIVGEGLAQSAGATGRRKIIDQCGKEC